MLILNDVLNDVHYRGAATIRLGYVVSYSVLDMLLSAWLGFQLVEKLLGRLTHIGILISPGRLNLHFKCLLVFKGVSFRFQVLDRLDDFTVVAKPSLECSFELFVSIGGHVVANCLISAQRRYDGSGDRIH